MLATLSEKLPDGPGWLYEVKWDGYRAICTLREGEATLTSTHRQRPHRARSPAVARALPRAVKTSDCVLDGEVCALDEQGRPSFALMQQGSETLVYEVFDLLELEGEPLVGLPFAERRSRLATLIDRRSAAVRLSETFEDGDALCCEAAKEQGLEGVRGEARRRRATTRASGRGTG